jgi:GxxExxY protein
VTDHDAQPARGPARDHEHDPLTHRIIGCAIEVHRHLGPGLLEVTYERAMGVELRQAGMVFLRQVAVPVRYKGEVVGNYRVDLVIENRVVVEIKSVDQLAGLHQAQLLAYMRVLHMSTGLLLNFNSEVLRTGVRRLAI